MRWRRTRRPAAAREHGSAPVWRRLLTVPTAPEAVRQVRLDTSDALTEYGIGRDTAFAGAVLLVVSELVANAVRHAGDRSPTVDVTVAVGAGQFVVGVVDQDPRLPDLSPEASGDGLRTVTDLTAAHGGTLRVEPAPHGRGKAMVARFRIPGVSRPGPSPAGTSPDVLVRRTR
ncbi:ATP-binding protein [Streptomyces albireticuli]|uniref:ATP-binding protein n=1 Tax=Streptomyces albireticuli TaxID=1940 RepID=A0A2A2D0E5_9ACTN|nr:ATP-binding protein [Streptomyces albireticuli]MCD9194667.1 ATP-binding protein [Streptomyces albireticuli]PAU44889.1 ATP-binding protein [Streptomyces albireticuli]